MFHVKKISELTGHSGAIYILEKGTDEDFIFSGSSDKIIAKWNLNTNSPEKFAAQLPAIIYSLCFLPEQNILLAGTSEGKVHVIDLKEKKETRILLNHNQPVYNIKYAPEQKLLLSAGGDGVLSVFTLDGFQTIQLLKLSSEKLRAIDIFGNTAAIACGDGLIRIIDLKNLKVKNEFQAHTGSAYTVKFSQDGSTLFSGGKDAHLKMWKSENDNWEIKKSIPAHNYAIYSIAFSPDQKYIATASRDKTIKIWNADSLEVLTRINKENHNGHINSVNTLFWDIKRNSIISAGDDRKIMVWEVK